MTPEERDRLTRVETKQDAMMKKLEAMETKVTEMNLTFAKMGGVGLALTAMGTAIGWGLTQVKGFLQLISGG